MKLIVLTDNTVLQSKNFLGEHGLSFYLEVDSKKILFDTGYSDVFMRNALKMGIDLLDLDYIILSHGHYDHTWGLSHYLPFYASAIKQGRKVKKPILLTHPDTFCEKFEKNSGEIGCMLSLEKLQKFFEVKLSKETYQISDNLIFAGEIPRYNDFEGKTPIGQVSKNDVWHDDFVVEDSALFLNSDEGVSIITGCSHSGICNISEYALKVCNSSRINSIVGGFHLINSTDEKLQKTIDYLSQVDELYPCHCVDFKSKKALLKYLNVNEIGVGLTLHIK